VSKPRANIYVDGLNLYRRALAGTPYKWLDLERMASLLLHDFEIQRIRYFTALLRHVPHDPAGPQRQQIYLRALRTNPKIVIHLGDLRADVRQMPLHPWQYDDSGRAITAKVRKTEGKGSDVNLATHLLLDAMRDSADLYVVISNDSDLVEPIRVVIEEFGRSVALIVPTQTPSKALLSTGAQIIHHLRAGVLQAAQFSDTLVDARGSFRRPEGW
jgi:uncharacterized LabA/DUF88 family protein